MTQDEEGDAELNALKISFQPPWFGQPQQPQACFWWQICTARPFLPCPGAVKWAVRVLVLEALFSYLLTIIYVFPLTAFFSKISVKKTIKDAFVMAMGNLYVSVTVLVIYALCAFLTWYFTELFMIWFAFGSYLASLFLRRVFEKYMEGDVEIAGEEGENVNKIVKK